MGYTSSDNSNPWTMHEASVKMESTMESTARNSEGKEREDDGRSAAFAAITTASPSIHPIPVELAANTEQNATSGKLPFSAFGTPTTVSTASSTDDASVDGLVDPLTFERLSLLIDDAPAGSTVTDLPWITAPTHRTGVSGSHRRSMSWENGHGMHPNFVSQAFPNSLNQWMQPSPDAAAILGQHVRHVDAWTGSDRPSDHARVACFRADQQMIDPNGEYGYLQMPHTDAWCQQGRYEEPQQYSTSHRMSPLPPSGQNHPARKGSNGPVISPPYNRQNRLRHPGSSPSVGVGPLGSGNHPRSSSEILKTLLRKKACLYEPDTSRVIALVTWMVGRELTLEHGYFSRQDLQVGVHACVAKKIEGGTITRTKVNRCMQIILNSCFQYIIPRPDGSEEKRDAFRKRFEESAQHDHAILANLPSPWNGVSVERDVILRAVAAAEESEKRGGSRVSPQHSPRLSGSEAPTGTHESDCEEHQCKRAVLFCFNENVKSAVDAFRCHNEFIRDTANASRLQLTAREWCSFFGKGAGSPHTCRNAGFLKEEMVDQDDFLGQMHENELAVFRTTFCAKQYSHDHDLCGFAHVEVSGGWLRRNFRTHSYRAEMCPNVVSIQDRHNGARRVSFNHCKNGASCQMAHSEEEIIYHPSRYKKDVCKVSGDSQCCALGDVCPNLHPHDSQHYIKKPINEYRAFQQRHSNLRQHGNFSSGALGRGVFGIPPSGAPTLYVSPAPFSSFEKHLQMPGLRNLFRRHSSVISAHLRTPVQILSYSNFGGEGTEACTHVMKKNFPTSSRE